MNAGESARQEARRARERAERLARRAELFEKGAVGENLTAAALEALGPGWVVLHDHRWPGRRFANIDHLVIGPGGVFVVDSKNWTGDVRVVDHVLRQNGRSREKAVAAAADAALAVAELAASYAGAVRPVLCFTRDEELTGWSRDVMICSTSNLVRMLQSRTPVLDPAQVSDAALRLDVSLREATGGAPSGGPCAGTQGRTSKAPHVSRPRPAKARTRGSGTRSQRGKPSSSRLVAVLAAGLLLMVAVPTVWPVAASAISDALVDQFLPDDEECVVMEEGAQAETSEKGDPRRPPVRCR